MVVWKQLGLNGHFEVDLKLLVPMLAQVNFYSQLGYSIAIIEC
jgi:hypothetical protein